MNDFGNDQILNKLKCIAGRNDHTWGSVWTQITTERTRFSDGHLYLGFRQSTECFKILTDKNVTDSNYHYLEL